ncbi:hypothetical protein K443DRAFT_664188 [Laccaria amethystina LaAM-08-1]|uniref:Uncharacterized protein n=1 Tax=Laccaria amethystina LaAM-08-1 TaxID=1095629 RepID=A0A0C9XSW4_9AGAR|nr:hypothetical protein K443DRAFT_664188 [Laccaria amethystina LaAM-08-1]
MLVPQPPSAAPPTSQSQLPFYYLFSATEPDYLVHNFCGLLVSVRCKSDGAWILKGRGSRHCSMSTRG